MTSATVKRGVASRLRAIFLVIAVCSAAEGAPARAQNPPPTKQGLDIGASMRLRYETIDGQVRPGFNASDALIDLRTIVTATYKTGPLRIGAEVYDSRSWLADARTPISTNEVNTLEPVQAWVAADIAHPFGAGTALTVKAGRFLLDLGSRRLVAADDYRNTTNAFTGLRADLGLRGGVKATLVYTLPQARLPDDLPSLLDNKSGLDRESFDQVLWGGLVSRARTVGDATVELGFFHLGERDAPGRPTRDRSLDTVDARVVRDPKPGRIHYQVEGIYQSGGISTTNLAGAPRVPVSAWFAHADLGYTFSGGWKPRLTAEFDIASGDKAGGTYTRFDSLFGMRRADLGPVGLYNTIARTNVVTPGARVEATPGKRFDVMFNYRLLWLAEPTDTFSGTGVRDATGASGSFAGQQFDARVRAWIVPERLRFEVDGVWLAKGRFLLNAPNAPATGDTRYLSINVTAYI
ncbi:alginate export family protein [Sphingomonas immobilis]|uniref:Alginate export family protein n=1 Tax=Sphingomonas immobilis TaxID=3063997 RepID=A0ABT8ZW14_9SPHN|nr:alginate export family protein [Sphingomonas sp. CA1-15]MDO7841770.1 alginate export family protein [Sphingomonas sp. CA1-15]